MPAAWPGVGTIVADVLFMSAVFNVAFEYGKACWQENGSLKIQISATRGVTRNNIHSDSADCSSIATSQPELTKPD